MSGPQLAAVVAVQACFLAIVNAPLAERRGLSPYPFLLAGAPGLVALGCLRRSGFASAVGWGCTGGQWLLCMVGLFGAGG